MSAPTASAGAPLPAAVRRMLPVLALLSAVAPLATDLKPQLRTLLQYHCGSPLLRTRQFMMDMQAL